MFKVTVSDKSGQQSRLDFTKPEISVGRMKGNDIVLPKGNVSKRHATIHLRDKSFYVNDHGSTNGTYINGRKVTNEQFVAEGEKIYIGDFILQLDAASGSNAQDFNPPPINRHTMPPQPPEGRPPHNTMFDPMEDMPRDPLRDTYTTIPPELESGRSAIGISGNYPSVPDGARDTVGAVEEFQQVGPPPGRKYDAALYPPSAPSAPSAPPSTPPGPRSGPSTPAIKHRDPITRPPAGGGYSEPPPPQERASSDLPERPLASSPPPEPRALPAAVRPGAAPQVKREFDAELFALQVDAIKLIAQKYPPEQWPEDLAAVLDSTKTRFRRELDAAFKAVSPGGLEEELRGVMTSEHEGLGALDALLDDPQVRDIYLNRYDQILVRRGAQLVQARHALSSAEVLDQIANRLLKRSGHEGELAAEIRLEGGTRLHIVMPPLASSGPLLTLRKPPTTHPALSDLVDDQVLSGAMAEFLAQAVQSGRSIAVAGPTASGKTTLLNALTEQIAEGVRVVAVEDYNHLSLSQQSAVRLEADRSSGFDKRFLLRQALAMHPQRLVLDECRGAEAYDWVTSVASGTEGSLLTVHGVDAADALGRLEGLCSLGGGDLSPRGIREQIARALNLLVVVHRTQDGAVRVQQIAEVQGVDLDAFRLSDIFYFKLSGAQGAFHPTGYIPLFYEDLRQHDEDLDFAIFQEQ